MIVCGTRVSRTAGGGYASRLSGPCCSIVLPVLCGEFDDDDGIAVIHVDAEPQFRRWLAQIIEREPGMRLAGAAANLAEAHLLIASEDFDVLLIDIALPDGGAIDVIGRVSQRDRSGKVMVVSALGDEDHVISAIRAGADGYLLKNAYLSSAGAIS